MAGWGTVGTQHSPGPSQAESQDTHTQRYRRTNNGTPHTALQSSVAASSVRDLWELGGYVFFTELEDLTCQTQRPALLMKQRTEG